MQIVTGDRSGIPVELAIAITVVGLVLSGIVYLLGTQAIRAFTQPPAAENSMTMEELEDLAEEAEPDERSVREAARFVSGAGDLNQQMKDAWREEKLAEGWKPHEIEAFLDNRPEIRLD